MPLDRVVGKLLAVPEGGRVVREIIVAVYVDENLDQFNARSRRLIETGS
jgi:hypothetical protein